MISQLDNFLPPSGLIPMISAVIDSTSVPTGQV